MITIDFKKSQGYFYSVQVGGHAKFAKYGQDIVCAAVTSSLQLCVNGILQVLKEKGTLVEEENLISLKLTQPEKGCGTLFLQSLYLHYALLEEEYPKNIEIKLTEV